MQFRLSLGRWSSLARQSVALALCAAMTAHSLAAGPTPATGTLAVPVDQKLFGALQ